MCSLKILQIKVLSRVVFVLTCGLDHELARKSSRNLALISQFLHVWSLLPRVCIAGDRQQVIFQSKFKQDGSDVKNVLPVSQSLLFGQPLT